MALKVELKPGERIILGESVITNDKQRTRLFIEGNAPILREKDILTAQTADSPAKRVYFAIQLMYLGGDISKLQKDYFALVMDIVRAAPSMLPIVDRINNAILTGSLYKALKEAKTLITHEKEIIDGATNSGFGTTPQADGGEPAA
ncbi:MAG: flagellar biosynthesis repressor FlbT [Hyphomicrobiales bacterium]